MPTAWLRDLKELVRPYYLKWFYFHLSRGNYPSHFQECWDYPSSVLGSSLNGHQPSESRRADILFLPMGDWHTRSQRTQHLASTFASLGHRCFYVNPHLGREFPCTYAHSPRLLVSTLEPHTLELHIHLRREPVFHHRCLRPDENRTVLQAIEKLLRASPSPCPVVIASFPLWGEVAVQLQQRLGCRLVYDCHDLLAGFGNISEDLLEAESLLFAKSDLVAFSAKWLMEKKLDEHAAVAEKALLLPNAVNHLDFEAAANRPVRHGSRWVKTIGYVGSLNFWFDVESVRRAALEHPEWRFVLIGRIESRNVDVLRSFPNVVFLGEVHYRDLARHLSEVDVAIIPFLKNALTMATNPIKLYEYFACGLPVVSARLPEVEQFTGSVYLADNPAQFVRQIENALSENDAGLRRQRISIAERESWLARCRTLDRELRRLLISADPATRPSLSATV
jgi:glycosyltransferase involved in cell wall biosynthesis